MNYIKVDKALESIDLIAKNDGEKFDKDSARYAIQTTETEDVVPVVRCSQCRKRYTTECALWFSQLDDKQYFCGAIHNDDFYCSYGERKDDK